jgi:hypothetical protein
MARGATQREVDAKRYRNIGDVEAGGTLTP